MFADLLNESGLSLDRLVNFCLVAQAGGVTKAAKGDPAKQSLFSRQIKELEEFFGIELIRRRGRSIVLTDAGEKLNIAARDCLCALWDFKTECKDLPVGVVVGAGESIIRWLLLPRLSQVQAKMPNVRLTFLNLTTAEVVRRLADGVVDFGIVRKDGLPRSLRTAGVGTLRYSVFVPKTVDGEARTGSRILDGLSLATLEGAGDFRQELAGLARKHDLQLNIKLECSSFPLVASALESGRVAAILPSIACNDFQGSGTKQITLPLLKDLDRELCLAWNPRLLRIRPVLDKACKLFSQAFQI